MLRDQTTHSTAQVMTLKNTRTLTVLENNSPSVTTLSCGASSSLISSSIEHLYGSSESFRTLNNGGTKSNSTERRLAWLRSQVVGDGVEFDSPFGRRRLTYADHTASGRSLRYIENFIINNVLPFYGNLLLFCLLHFIL